MQYFIFCWQEVEKDLQTNPAAMSDSMERVIQRKNAGLGAMVEGGGMVEVPASIKEARTDFQEPGRPQFQTNPKESS